MRLTGTMGLLLLTCSLLGAQNLPEDPVMKARTQRAQLQGINEADLPPVPRSVTEPPPLPAPELHRKDTPGGRKAHGRAGRRGKGGPRAKAGGSPSAPPAAHRSATHSSGPGHSPGHS